MDNKNKRSASIPFRAGIDGQKYVDDMKKGIFDEFGRTIAAVLLNESRTIESFAIVINVEFDYAPFDPVVPVMFDPEVHPDQIVYTMYINRLKPREQNVS